LRKPVDGNASQASRYRLTGATMFEQQKFFDRFRRIYNVKRPHEGIGQDRPARRFRASPRPYPSGPSSPQYPDHWEKRKVMCNGVLRWKSKDVFLSETFDGHTVAFEPIDYALWRVHFYHFVIGTFDERSRTIT